MAMTPSAAEASTESAAPVTRGPGMITVVVSSAAGTAFEWYDFFVFGALASILSRQFVAGSPTAGFIFTLGAFAAGFFVRPFGALVFGRMGDQRGRKVAFLATMTLMGLATISIGLLPTAAVAGPLAAYLLVAARLVQGFAMGGEYGGAAVYVAEYADAGRRGYLTSWIQTAAAIGLLCALGVVLATRTILGEAAFATWGWRLPFLASSILLVLSLLIRLRLEESPIFRKMKARQGAVRTPLVAAFRGHNLRTMLLALFAILLAQGAVWYATHFYVQFFLERVVRLPPAIVNSLVAAAVVCTAGLYILFGALSDRIGRKPVMLFGMVLALATLYPGFWLLTGFGNPGLREAASRAPIVVAASPADCSFTFDVLGGRKIESNCDVAKQALADAGVPYRSVAAPAGALTSVRVGQRVIVARSLAGLSPVAASGERGRVTTSIKQELAHEGYPTSADPVRINIAGLLAVIVALMTAAAALYGPQAAALVELFPTEIRYTAFSVPYNIGTGWVGGFLPITAFAIVNATGNPYSGLLYPAFFTAISVVAALLWLPETRARALD